LLKDAGYRPALEIRLSSSLFGNIPSKLHKSKRRREMKRNATLVLALLLLSAFGGGMIWLGSHSLVRGQTSATQQGKSAGLGYRRLGIEVGLSKPFNVPGATKGHILQTFLRVPNGTDGGTGTAFSAIRVAPKIVGDKITVNVSLVSGDTSLVKNCKDWDQLKESPLASYTLSEGEEVSVSNYLTWARTSTTGS
jgi:hypothetical protein